MRKALKWQDGRSQGELRDEGRKRSEGREGPHCALMIRCSLYLCRALGAFRKAAPQGMSRAQTASSLLAPHATVFRISIASSPSSPESGTRPFLSGVGPPGPLLHLMDNVVVDFPLHPQRQPLEVRTFRLLLGMEAGQHEGNTEPDDVPTSRCLFMPRASVPSQTHSSTRASKRGFRSPGYRLLVMI